MCSFALIPAVARGETFAVSWNWVPSLDARLSFVVDGLSLLFMILISSIGTLVLVYARAYLDGHPDRRRLYTWLLLFMTAMLGLVVADNLITLFVFWELTSITSYMLIGFEHENPRARAAALQALLVTGFGGLALLAGFLLLGQAAGSYELSVLRTKSDVLRNGPLLAPCVVLILIGAFTKSAQFPFHFWLPNAMEAPTPVSAYLHSATMVKAGVYLIARLSPALGGIAIWDNSIIAVGALTALTGACLALPQVDLKKILAYSTVSALGTMVMLLGCGTPGTTTAAIVFLLCHALYKAALFLMAGAVDHCAGTRDLRQLGGLARVMPWLAFAAVIAAMSKVGLPPASGFVAKELMYESLLAPSSRGTLPLLVVFFVSVSFAAVGAMLAIRPFFGRAGVAAASAHRVPRTLLLPPLVLGTTAFVIGAYPGPLGHYLIAPAVAAIVPNAEPVSLKLWHGFNFPLLLTALAVMLGIVIYAAGYRIRLLAARWRKLAAWGPSAGYERGLTVFARRRLGKRGSCRMAV